MTEMEPKQERYDAFTVRMAIQLAAPHTWPAAIIPCLIAVCAASVFSETVSISLAIALLVICILMQSAVNTFNDYYDFVKGADSLDDNVEESPHAPSPLVFLPRHLPWEPMPYIAQAGFRWPSA